MSLFRSESLTIALCPSGVGVVHARSGRDVVGEALPAAGDVGTPDWANALAVLAAWLGDARPRGKRARLVVSASHLRVCLVPWTDRRLSAEQERGWVRLHLEAAYGDMAQWHIAADPGAFGEPRLACALPADLVAGWHGLARAHGIAAVRLEPYFALVWNRWRGEALPGQLWGVAESGRVVWSVCGRRGWAQVCIARCDAGPNELPQLAAYEARRQGAGAGQPIVLHLPRVPAAAAGAYTGSTVRWLSLASADDPECLAMARLGAAR